MPALSPSQPTSTSSPPAIPARLPFVEFNQLWSALDWTIAIPTIGNSRTTPVRFPVVPNLPGLYRITLKDEAFWAEHVCDSIPVRATRRITDAHLLTAHWRPHLVLSLGKTTGLSTGLQQHLSSNEKNNRLLKRLRSLFPNLTDAQLRQACVDHMQFETVEVPDWRRRFLLENYGTALHQSLLDFTAEH